VKKNYLILVLFLFITVSKYSVAQTFNCPENMNPANGWQLNQTDGAVYIPTTLGPGVMGKVDFFEKNKWGQYRNFN
jgi:hypothetical protein